ncbi:hypothetical protein VTK56DRAFT_4863 [Thermocarpiscus australiensis]
MTIHDLKNPRSPLWQVNLHASPISPYRPWATRAGIHCDKPDYNFALRRPRRDGYVYNKRLRGLQGKVPNPRPPTRQSCRSKDPNSSIVQPRRPSPERIMPGVATLVNFFWGLRLYLGSVMAGRRAERLPQQQPEEEAPEISREYAEISARVEHVEGDSSNWSTEARTSVFYIPA